MRQTLRIQLSAYLPASKLEGPFTAETESPLLTTTFRLVDAAVRVLAPLALTPTHPASAQGLRALPAVTDRAQALKTMMSIEKVAHATKGPSPFFRAIGGVPSASVLVADADPSGSQERLERSLQQLCGALVRVAGMSLKLGLSADAVLAPLRAALEA